MAIKPKKPFDIEDLIVGKLCLEQCQFVHKKVKTKPGRWALGNMGWFTVDIILISKKFVKAKLHDDVLTASETLILL